MRYSVEFTKYISPDGDEYSFDSDDRLLMTEDGLGMPPIEYITQQGAFQHGETPLDFRLGSRTIQLQIRQDSCSREKYWEKRSLLINMIRPNRVSSFAPGILRKEFPDGSKRDIKVSIQQGPTFVARNLDTWDEWGFTETLRFIAHDPIFFNPAKKIINIPLQGSVQSNLIFPTEFPILFGATAFFLNNSIIYPGSWIEFPVLKITGPANGFKIENLETSEFIKLDYSIQAGEIVTLDLTPGVKTIENSLGINLNGVATIDCDFVTFHIEPSPEAPGGTNTFLISASGVNDESNLAIEYYERFIGI